MLPCDMEKLSLSRSEEIFYAKFMGITHADTRIIGYSTQLNW